MYLILSAPGTSALFFLLKTFSSLVPLHPHLLSPQVSDLIILLTFSFTLVSMTVQVH